jgi:hypothetical protein
MRDKYLCAASILVLLVTLPLLIWQLPKLEVQEKQIKFVGIVERSFSTNGITIAQVRPQGTIPVVFFKGADLIPGQIVDLNVSLESYQDRVELIVK